MTMITEEILKLNLGFIHSFGYILVFLFTFLEASPFFGIFVPGAIVIFFAGFLAKMKLLSFGWVLGLAITGAVLGDLGGYLFGRYFGKEFLHKYGKWFLIKKEYIEKSCEIANNHVGKSLVIGRLNPLTRPAAPFIVGANKVNFWKFMFYNIIGGVLWGLIFVSIGYFFGANYGVANDVEKLI
jgi:membrane-associated protein